MKKILFTLFSLLLALTSVNGQLQRHDFNLSVGAYSTSFFDAVGTDLLVDPGFADVSKTIGEQTGAIFFTYRFYPSFRFSIGILGGLERIKGDIQLNGQSSGQYGADFYTFGLEVDYRWVLERWIQLYSGIGLGVSYKDEYNQIDTVHNSEEGFKPTAQLNVLGIRLGGRAGFFIEGGFGYKGIIKAGFSLQL